MPTARWTTPGLVVEAGAAFGYGQDGYEVANDLAVLHDVGWGCGPSGSRW